jgi:hypothetical protein
VTASSDEEGPPRRLWLERIASIGTSAQAAIPGLYAWSITVAPAAWSSAASWLVKVLAALGVLALVTAPIVEAEPPPSTNALVGRGRFRRGPAFARAWSVWGFVLSSSLVWALAPSALSPARLDGLRGALGMIGWALFAFASAGPVLRADQSNASRIVASASLKPRSELPRGDGIYVASGVLLALSMQAVGWGVTVPERAVLVRLVTVVCGMAILSATTSIALARHATRTPESRRNGIRRALPWFVMLSVLAIAAVLVKMAH